MIGIERLHGARLAEHQQPASMPRIRSCQLSRPATSSNAADVLRDRFLDAREIQDAFAQHRALHQLEFGVFFAAPPARRAAGSCR